MVLQLGGSSNASGLQSTAIGTKAEALDQKTIKGNSKKGNESPVASAYIKIGIDDIDKIDNVSTDHSGQDNCLKYIQTL